MKLKWELECELKLELGMENRMGIRIVGRRCRQTVVADRELSLLQLALWLSSFVGF